MRRCPQDIKTVCYNALVRPTLEYASCVWAPNTKKNVAKVESVQRCAARYVKNDFSKESSVTAMLNDLNWDTLQHRRSMAKVTMMYTITNNLVHVDISTHQLTPLESRTRGHDKRFYIPKTRTSLLKGAFSPDTIRLWNSLPQDAINSTSVDIFKEKIRDVDFSS